MLLELMMRRPRALAQFRVCPVQDAPKSGSLSDGITANGVGADGVGW